MFYVVSQEPHNDGDSAPLNSLLYIQSAVQCVLKFRREARYNPQRAETYAGGSWGPAMVFGSVAFLPALATQTPGQPHLLIYLGSPVPVCCCFRSHVGSTFRQALE